jgi:hypothetical protein
VDLWNAKVLISDSKTPNGFAELALTELRSTYATRLSAGGVADEWLLTCFVKATRKSSTNTLEMKLQMEREALTKINRHANEITEFAAATVSESGNSDAVLAQ